jgi:hypothetical protein
MGEASSPITFDRGVFHEVAAHRVRGFSPLAGNLVRQFHCDLHLRLGLPPLMPRGKGEKGDSGGNPGKA